METPVRKLVTLTVAGALAACASSPGFAAEGQNRVVGVISQPFEDLSLKRTPTPEALKDAAEAPYAPVTGPQSCEAIREEIALLDESLGPDVDTTSVKREGISDLTLAALKGAVALPFRGVVRRISGAERRARELQAATLAGIARRGYLKGLAASKSCTIVVADR